MLFISQVDITNCYRYLVNGGGNWWSNYYFPNSADQLLFALLIHYAIVLIANWVAISPIYKAYGTNYQFNLQNVLFITVIYLIIWLVIRFMQINDVQRVNRRLKQRQKKNH